MGELCKNCNTNMQGLYCHICGEKKLTETDFHISRYVSSFISSLSNIDNKVLRTLKALLFKPGKLSADYFYGLRKPYLSPIQLFLIVTVIFFLFTPEFDIFYVPAKWFFVYLDPADTSFINLLVMDKMAELDLSRSELALKYNLAVKNSSKAFLFLGIPILALGSYLCRPKSIPQFGKHLIFATHNLTFFIFWFFLLLLISFQLPMKWTPDSLMRGISFGSVLIYFLLANRRTWSDSSLRAALSGFFQLSLFIMFLMVYRTGISVATLYNL